MTPLTGSEAQAARGLYGQAGGGGYTLADGKYDASGLFDAAGGTAGHARGARCAGSLEGDTSSRGASFGETPLPKAPLSARADAPEPIKANAIAARNQNVRGRRAPGSSRRRRTCRKRASERAVGPMARINS